MRKPQFSLWLLCALSALLLSLPWLVPHTGALALVALVPLLCAEAVIEQCRVRASWIYPAATFVAWNAATTFWVCNATVGGGIFAVLANAAQMLLVWLLFRLARKKMGGGVLPYIFLAAMWLAWERHYFDVEISWPWLTLGGAFAQSTRTVQWYEYTGMLGGSLWIWVSNLGIFGLLVALSDGYWQRWGSLARACATLGITLVIAGPVVASKMIWTSYEERSEGTVDVLVAQPNFDPYQKFQSMTQAQQTSVLLDLFGEALAERTPGPVLLLAPETFTSDIQLNDPDRSPTLQSFRRFLGEHPGAEMLFGASTYEFFLTHAAPTILARPYGEGWVVGHNSALTVRPAGPVELYHKSKLVVGTELTPYPGIFVPLDNWLSKKMGVSGLMGRCVGQDDVSLLHFGDQRVPLGCAVCYESVYGEYCAEYVRKGAQALTIITNDAWWGNTPGYRQHLSYARLRAIELRRDIARCGNTGISCFIDQRGEILDQSQWWTRQTLSGQINLSSEQTAFVRHGDVVGRVCTLLFLLLAALLLVRLIVPGKKR
ncbi:MAG: apolipoprotein N-acyltransferase [Bacteroidales bacterium]|jgi:apolipoprotein N-acyltransferase|nr:apolipoprotein N-acyltransferase [Bacteroidales bacterium]